MKVAPWMAFPNLSSLYINYINDHAEFDLGVVFSHPSLTSLTVVSTLSPMSILGASGGLGKSGESDALGALGGLGVVKAPSKSTFRVPPQMVRLKLTHSGSSDDHLFNIDLSNATHLVDLQLNHVGVLNLTSATSLRYIRVRHRGSIFCCHF